MFSWLSGASWVLLTTAVMGGLAVAVGAKEFFSNSSTLEQKISEKLNISNKNLSTTIPGDLEKVIEKGKELVEKLVKKIIETLNTKAHS